MTKLAPEAYGFTPDLEASILSAGVAVGAARTAAKKAKKAKAPKPVKEPRKTLVGPAWDAVNAGMQPPRMKFPLSNYWSQTKADALHEMMLAGDMAGLSATSILGINTYARALLGYRDACIAYLSGQAKAINGEAA